MKRVLLVLLVLAAYTSAQAPTLHITNDLEKRMPLGEYTVTAQIIDDTGTLVDVNNLNAEIEDAFATKISVHFLRVSLGTYQAPIDLNIPNIYYITFLPDKQGFEFTGLETTVHGDKPVPWLSVESWLLPISIVIIVAATIVWRKRRSTTHP